MMRPSRRSLILGAGAAIITRPALATALRSWRGSRFAFPGTSPGFDPTHPAAQGCLFSVVATTQSAVNILTGKGPDTVSGLTNNVSQIGPGISAGYAKFNTALTFPSSANTMVAAAIFTTTGSAGGVDSGIVSWGDQANFGSGIALKSGTNLGALVQGADYFIFSQTLALNTPYFVILTTGPNVQNGLQVNLLTGRVDYGTVANGQIVATRGYNYFIFGSNHLTNNCYVHAGTIGTGYLSPAQIKFWAANPWSFWYPQEPAPLFMSSFLGPSNAAPACAPSRTLTGVGC